MKNVNNENVSPVVAREVHNSEGPAPSRHALLDRLGRPLRDLRVSVTDECNFRCTYCMPKELFGEGHPFLPPKALLSFDEIESIVARFTHLGVEKVKITGGEPLLRMGVHNLIGRIRRLSGIDDIGLITNGYHLPNLAKHLRQAGLRRITVSLDSIDQENFGRIAGRSGGLDKVLSGITAARKAGFDPIKVNMVVQRGVNDHEVVDMARYARENGLELRYIEYMDVGRRNSFEGSLLVPNSEIRDLLDAEFGIDPVNPDYYGEVADTYRYRDGAGRVGFVSSMTQPFCGSCTRLRLSADGKLYRCLFSGLALDVRSQIRDSSMSYDERLEAIDASLRRFWGGRDNRYSEVRAEERESAETERSGRVEMYRMGG